MIILLLHLQNMFCDLIILPCEREDKDCCRFVLGFFPCVTFLLVHCKHHIRDKTQHHATNAAAATTLLLLPLLQQQADLCVNVITYFGSWNPQVKSHVISLLQGNEVARSDIINDAYHRSLLRGTRLIIGRRLTAVIGVYLCRHKQWFIWV